MNSVYTGIHTLCTLTGICIYTSKCGYTASGYSLLSKLSKMPGVEVAIFPCNQVSTLPFLALALYVLLALMEAVCNVPQQFGGQEPGSDAEVAQFCVAKGVDGANLFTKADVNGPNTRPTYKFLKEQKVLGEVGWNFAGKFIVDKKGNVMPASGDIEGTIAKLVAA